MDSPFLDDIIFHVARPWHALHVADDGSRRLERLEVAGCGWYICQIRFAQVSCSSSLGQVLACLMVTPISEPWFGFMNVYDRCGLGYSCTGRIPPVSIGMHPVKSCELRDRNVHLPAIFMCSRAMSSFCYQSRGRLPAALMVAGCSFSSFFF